MSIKKIHLTDLMFFKYCEKNFNINRGVYNTIDNWFYDKGILNIEQRRIQIISFLVYKCEESSLDSQFGKGGLSFKLKKYLNLQSEKETVKNLS